MAGSLQQYPLNSTQFAWSQLSGLMNLTVQLLTINDILIFIAFYIIIESSCQAKAVRDYLVHALPQLHLIDVSITKQTVSTNRKFHVDTVLEIHFPCRYYIYKKSQGCFFCLLTPPRLKFFEKNVVPSTINQ